jgi:hypothetical protein
MSLAHTDNTTPLNMGVEADRATLSKRWDQVTVGSSELLAQAVNEESKASFVLAHFKARLLSVIFPLYVDIALALMGRRKSIYDDLNMVTS